MTSKAAKRRNKKRWKVPPRTKVAETVTLASEPAQSTRPTQERLKHGTWAKPTGAGKEHRPMVDLASDYIGQLFHSKQINSSQEQAARTFQELRAAYVQELGTTGFGSCLADNQQGHDSSDGNPEAIRAYEALTARIGRIKTASLVLMTEGTEVDITALRRALDEVAR